MRTILAAAALVFAAASAFAQAAHDHTAPVSGVPQGIPYFCANPTITSTSGGAWSDPRTWTAGRVPVAGDKVFIAAGANVSYDVASDARLDCIELHGTLAFRADRDTRLKVANLTVMDEGTLQVGTEQQPIARGLHAEIVIADQPLDGTLDPAEVGTGIQGLGKVRMHGALKSPTFVRLAAEPLASQSALQLEAAPDGWAPGDELVIPDTREILPGNGAASHDERVRIAAIDGTRVALAAPLAFDHKGARTPDGALVFLPHVGNITRNIVIRSENPDGTRGHTIFTSRADVDIRYAAFRDMGRTKMGVLDNTEFDAAGHVVHLGENQIGRYAIHFHHDFGPKTTPADGYQFTLIGNAVDGAPKWGITVHNSDYGLIKDNVVYNAAGAGIVTEDGNEAFNVFDHNFSMRVRGSGEFAVKSGYGGPAPDPGGEGAAFWFRGPDNYIRNNVAANADAVGFGLAVGSLGTVRIPKFKGADITSDADIVALDTTTAPVLEFANNEAYGAMQAGAAWGWNGTVATFRVWNTSKQGITASPTDSLTIDHLVVRGDPAAMMGSFGVWQNPVGVWISNYAAKTVRIIDADIQGMRVGVASPFYTTRSLLEPGRGDGSAIVDGGYFRNYVGVAIATGYSTDNETTTAIKKAVVRAARFDSLNVPASPINAAGAVSMNYGMSGGDTERRDPIEVHDFNGAKGDDFNVYYSLEAPPAVAPCQDVRQGIEGWACR